MCLKAFNDADLDMNYKTKSLLNKLSITVIVTHKPQGKTLKEKLVITVNSLLPQAYF